MSDKDDKAPAPEPNGPSIPKCDHCGKLLTQCKCTHNDLVK